MKINVDRMAKLAGLGKNSTRASRSRSLNEGMGHDSSMEEMDHDAMEEMDHDAMEEGMYEEDMYEEDMEAEGMEEMIEVDEVELVQELRRAKKIMLESKKRNSKQALQEASLKKIIEEEVQNIFGEMDLNLNSDWVYGSNKPRRSKKGYSHQGSFLKGVGFK